MERWNELGWMDGVGGRNIYIDTRIFFLFRDLFKRFFSGDFSKKVCLFVLKRPSPKKGLE